MSIAEYFQKRFIFFNDRGIMGILAIQFLLVYFFNEASVTQSLFLAGVLIIIWSLLHQVQKHTLPHFLVTLFWASVLYGGIGMLIGHKIDQHFFTPQTHIKMHTISLNAALLNWMTVVMLVTCLCTCPFLPQCLARKKGWCIHLFVHGSAILAMLIGIYFSHLLAVEMDIPHFVRFYLAVGMMGLMACIGYYIALRISDRFSFTKLDP